MPKTTDSKSNKTQHITGEKRIRSSETRHRMETEDLCLALISVPLIVDGSVHLGLQLIGASADRPAMTASSLGTRVLLKILPERERKWSNKRKRTSKCELK